MMMPTPSRAIALRPAYQACSNRRKPGPTETVPAAETEIPVSPPSMAIGSASSSVSVPKLRNGSGSSA
jgi:hypothetical protein